MNTNNSQISRSPMWDWPAWIKGSMPNPFDVFAAPQTLTQSILPGWVLGGVVNVTEENSSDPDTERQIVAKQSYGRQLGRIMDAVVVLVEEQMQAGRKSQAFDKLLELNREINAIKTRAAATRLNHVITDLAALKENAPKEYGRVAAALREALK